MRKLSSYPTLHHFITRFVFVHMFDKKEEYESILDELSHYEVSFCKCGKCGSVELYAPKEDNIFSTYYEGTAELFPPKKDNDSSVYKREIVEKCILCVNFTEIVMAVHATKDPRYINLEVIDNDWKEDTVPYWSEVTTHEPNHVKAKERAKKFFAQEIRKDRIITINE